MTRPPHPLCLLWSLCLEKNVGAIAYNNVARKIKILPKFIKDSQVRFDNETTKKNTIRSDAAGRFVTSTFS